MDSLTPERFDEWVALLNAFVMPRELRGVIEATPKNCSALYAAFTSIRRLKVGSGSAWARYIDGEFKD